MIQIVKDFITPEEEKQLLSSFRHTSVTSGTQRNMITRYGSTLPYRAPVQSRIIPEKYKYLCERLLKQGYVKELPDSITINEYHKGQSIDWHIDSPESGPVILVLSLLSEATLALKKEGDPNILEFKSLPRSLTVMENEHRYDYKHCIYPVPDKRFSMVFRKGTEI